MNGFETNDWTTDSHRRPHILVPRCTQIMADAKHGWKRCLLPSLHFIKLVHLDNFPIPTHKLLVISIRSKNQLTRIRTTWMVINVNNTWPWSKKDDDTDDPIVMLTCVDGDNDNKSVRRTTPPTTTKIALMLIIMMMVTTTEYNERGHYRPVCRWRRRFFWRHDCDIDEEVMQR